MRLISPSCTMLVPWVSREDMPEVIRVPCSTASEETPARGAVITVSTILECWRFSPRVAATATLGAGRLDIGGANLHLERVSRGAGPTAALLLSMCRAAATSSCFSWSCTVPARAFSNCALRLRHPGSPPRPGPTDRHPGSLGGAARWQERRGPDPRDAGRLKARGVLGLQGVHLLFRGLPPEPLSLRSGSQPPRRLWAMKPWARSSRWRFRFLAAISTLALALLA